MAGMSNSLIDKVVNATTPTGASGAPGAFAAYGGSAMKVRLNSTSSNKTTAGTELTGGGYTAGGSAVPSTPSDASSGGNGTSLPKTTAMSWTNSSGGAWSIVSFDLTDSAGVRTWFGDFNGAPISVANNNTFQIAAGGITINAS